MTNLSNEKITELLQLAADEARKGFMHDEGGPFGAVVIKDGKILSAAHNMVLKNNDPTAHAEVMAIRLACQKIQSHDLEGAVIIATGEPCPMCLSAIIWANIKECIYANTVEQAEKINFRDSMIYRYLRGENEVLTKVYFPLDECAALYEDYSNRQHQIY